MTRNVWLFNVIFFLCISAMAWSAHAKEEQENISERKATPWERAPNLSFHRQDGSAFTLKDHWRDGNIYVFLIYSSDYQGQSNPVTSDIYQNPQFAKLLSSPQKIHYVFINNTGDPNRRIQELRAINDKLNASLNEVRQPHQRQWLKNHIHLAQEPLSGLSNGEKPIGASWINKGFVIDNEQILVPFGPSFARFPLSSENRLWLVAEAEAAAYRQNLNQTDLTQVTRVIVFNRQRIAAGWTGRGEFATVTLPDMETMKQNYNKLELYLKLDCRADDCKNESGPFYDFATHFYVCRDESCDQEMGRWITPYGMGGEWQQDITPLLPFLQQGGPTTFRFWVVNPYEVTLELRLSKDPTRKLIPTRIEPLFEGGPFNEAYGQFRDPKMIAVPKDAGKTEIVAITTGHGWGLTQENCAEFCNHEHVFRINGEHEVRYDFPNGGTLLGCVDHVKQGVPANQAGNWFYGRAGWCPGKPAEFQQLDISTLTSPGSRLSIAYAGFYQGQPYRSTPALSPNPRGIPPEINHRSYLVTYSRQP